MPEATPFEPSLTGLLRAAWRPRKSITVLWRRVTTIAPEAYAALMAWAATASEPGETWPWLTVMADNEAPVDAQQALAEIQRLLRRRPPAEIAETARLLHDLIWEACEATNDWLGWRPCRVCGRRWATAEYLGLTLCPLHANAAAIEAFLREEMERFPGLVDHSVRLAALAAREAPLTPDPPRRVALDLTPVAGDEAEVRPTSPEVAS